jgi:hypothetical protein
MRGTHRVARIHWWRAKNVWSVVFSDHCEHYKRLVILRPMQALTQNKSPRAYLYGRIALVRHGDWAEVV